MDDLLLVLGGASAPSPLLSEAFGAILGLLHALPQLEGCPVRLAPTCCGAAATKLLFCASDALIVGAGRSAGEAAARGADVARLLPRIGALACTCQ